MPDTIVDKVVKPDGTYHRVGRTTASGMRVFGEDGYQRHETRGAAMKAANASDDDEHEEPDTMPPQVTTQGAAPDIVGPTGIPSQDEVEKTSPAQERDAKAEEAEAKKRKQQVQKEQDEAGLNQTDPGDEDDGDTKGKREAKADKQLEAEAQDRKRHATHEDVGTKAERPDATASLQAETDDALAHERDATKAKRGRKAKEHQPGVDDNMPEPTGPDRA